jgi:hypothetical protein
LVYKTLNQLVLTFHMAQFIQVDQSRHHSYKCSTMITKSVQSRLQDFSKCSILTMDSKINVLLLETY